MKPRLIFDSLRAPPFALWSRTLEVHQTRGYMPRRTTIFAVLAAVHLGCFAAARAGAEFLAPAVAATIYAPLYLLESVGLPVFGATPSGGWAAPSPLGWLLTLGLWFSVWWAVASLVAVLLRLSRKAADSIAKSSGALSAVRSPLLADMKNTPAKQPDQTDNNQIYRDDVVQQPRHNQNENAGNQRNQRGQA